MKKRTLKITGSIATVVLLLLSFNHCVVEKKVNKSKKHSEDKSPSTEVSLPRDDRPFIDNNSNLDDEVVSETSEDMSTGKPHSVVREKVSVGVKNYEQILYTMSLLTGVSVNHKYIIRSYEGSKYQMPSSNDIRLFQPTNQRAIVKLAAEFCHRLVIDEKLRKVMWPDFVFSSMVKSLDTDGREHLVDRTIDHFWSLSEKDEAIKLKAKDELYSLINDLMIGRKPSSTLGTRDVVRGVCTAVLSSIHVVTL